MQKENCWKADLYLRLSKEDADLGKNFYKTESNSIVNQKKLMEEYLKGHPEIELYQIKIDDGCSGADFNRPGFLELIKDIKENGVNCVIVKDLSRLGRDYIETGRYLEQVFPAYGVRFISILEQIDSQQQRESDMFLIPFKNLMNNSYLWDTSKKIRTNLEICQKCGRFTGAFVSYGYRKKEGRPYEIEPDPYASAIVADIFEMMLEGKGAAAIAGCLNERGVLSPMEYKKGKGRYHSGFSAGLLAEWTPSAILRVLKNEIYIGTLEQGKSRAENYKMKKRKMLPKEEWVSHREHHEPILCRELFFRVQDLLGQDTRSSPCSQEVPVFSGIVKCAYCGENLVKKTVRANGTAYRYLVCSTRRRKKNLCKGVQIREDKLERLTSSSLLRCIRMQGGEEPGEEELWEKKLREKEAGRLRELYLETKTMEENLRAEEKRLRKDEAEGILTQEEYAMFASKLQTLLDKVIREKQRLSLNVTNLAFSCRQRKIEYFKFMRGDSAPELTRKLMVLCMEEVRVSGKNEVQFYFRFRKGGEENRQKKQTQSRGAGKT